MKNLKSVLAIIMVAIIGSCLTGCQTPAQKAESERLVSESIAVSERIVSERVSASESAVESERLVFESVSASESASVAKSVYVSESASVLESIMVSQSISESIYNEEHADEIAEQKARESSNRKFNKYFAKCVYDKDSGVVTIDLKEFLIESIETVQNYSAIIDDTYKDETASCKPRIIHFVDGVMTAIPEKFMFDFGDQISDPPTKITVTFKYNDKVIEETYYFITTF
jgi:hypothetical protein